MKLDHDNQQIIRDTFHIFVMKEYIDTLNVLSGKE